MQHTPMDEIKACLVVRVRKRETGGAVEQRVDTVPDGHVTTFLHRTMILELTNIKEMSVKPT